jgi:WD40 repeat protein
MPSEDRPRVVLVVIAHTQYKDWEPLKELRSAVDALVQKLDRPGTGYQILQRRLIVGGTKRDVEDGLSSLLTELRDNDRLVVYWTGHGVGDGHHYLVTHESPLHGLTTLNALRADALGEVMVKSKAEKILVLVDTCYSSEGARLIAEEVGRILGRRTVAAGREPYVAVIPSAHSAQKAEAGVFCRALTEVLTGTDPALRRWTDRDEFIPIDYLGDALLYAMRAAMGPSWQPPLPTSDGFGSRFLPNPRFRVSPAADVETSRRQLQIPETLALAARGIEAGGSGSYFTPRKVIGRQLAWLQEPGAGMSVLTGSPGAGKSAVLGRLLLLSDPTFGAQARLTRSADDPLEGQLPPPAFVDAALHARGKTAEQCGRLIADQLDVPLGVEGGTFDGQTLVAAIAGRTRRPVIIIDALDEAAEPFAVATLAVALAAQGGARVAVGTRRSLDGRIVPSDEDRHARLKSTFGSWAFVVDLDDEVDTRDEIASYVTRRLLDSRHRDQREAVEQAARSIADAARGSFLYARVVSRALQSADRLDGPLPSDALEAFVSDLRSRFTERLPMVDSVFAALAWSAGDGVSRAVWPAMATAVSDGAPVCSDGDVSWVLDHAGWYVLETQESGQTVYRLVHQAFADYYRSRAVDNAAIRHRIAVAIAQGCSGLDWLNADPYLHRHLAEHASHGGTLDTLVQDIGYLAAAEPTSLLPVLNTLEDSTARRFATLYRGALERLRTASRADRMAMLQLAAQQDEPDLAPRLRPLLVPRWRSRWAYWRRTVPSTLAMALDPAADAAALVDIEPQGPSVVYAQGAELHAVALRSALPQTWTVRIEHGAVTRLVCGEMDGTVFIVSGDDAGYLHAFRIGASDTVAGVLAHAKPVRGIALLNELDPPLLATCGDDGTLALWTFPELLPVARQKVMPVLLSVAAMRQDKQLALIVSGDTYPDDDGDQPAASMWSVPELKRLATFDVPALIDHLQVAMVGAQPVVIGSRYAEVHSWLASGRILPVQDGTDEPVRGNYFMLYESDHAHASLMLNAGGQLRRLTLSQAKLTWPKWRAPDVSIEVTPWIETVGGAWLGPVTLWGRRYLVSIQERLRLWDLEDLETAIDAAPRTAAEMFQQQQSFGVLSTAATDTIVWSGLDSGELRAFDAATGRVQRSLPIEDGRPVALRMGQFDGRPCLLVGCYGGQIHRLDPDTGRPLAAPISVGGPVTDMAVFTSFDSAFIAATTESRSDQGHRHYHVRLWQMMSGEEIDTREDARLSLFGAEIGSRLSVDDYERTKPLKAVTFLSAREGPLVAAGGDPVSVSVWDVATLEHVAHCKLPTAGRSRVPNVVSLAQLLANGDLLLVAGTDDGSIVAWELTEGAMLWTRGSGPSSSTQVAAVQWGGASVVASGGWDGVLRIWTPAGEAVDLVHLGAAIWNISALPDGSIAVGTNRGLVVLASM